MLSPDQLHPGDKALVRTVFQGSRIEEFEAEIVGVMRGGRAEGDLIVGKATSDRVIKTGVAQGMSGSPVYVDGKLIGALSSAFAFSREPVFGITPIGEMLEVLSQPNRSAPDGSAGPSGVEISGASERRYRELRWEDPPDGPRGEDSEPAAAGALGAEPGRLAPGAGLAPLPLPLACAGLNPGALGLARRWLEPFGLAVTPGGRAASRPAMAADLEPGAAVAIDLLRGDLQLSAIGTLTYRDGDRVLLFGHPFFQTGDLRLPLSSAEITTVIGSQYLSFKLGARGRTVGAVTQDRRTAVAGRIGETARLMPVAVNVGRPGAKRQAFRFESIEDRMMAPSLIGLAALNSLLESGGIGANQTLVWTLALNRKGSPPLVLKDIEAGENPTSDFASGIASPIGFLLNNPFRRVVLDSVSVSVEVVPGRDQWTLRAARVMESAVRPGAVAHVRCEIERWRGGREVRDLTLAVPEELPDGRYTLWLGGGPELSRYEASHLPGRYRPVSLDDAWRRLAVTRASDALYAVVFAKSPEVSVDGSDYPELPTSALALLSSDQSAGDRGRRGDLAKLGEQRLGLDGLVKGELQINLNVNSQAP